MTLKPYDDGLQFSLPRSPGAMDGANLTISEELKDGDVLISDG